MTITPTTLTRAAGLAAVAGGLLFIAVQLKHPHLNAAFTTTTEWDPEPAYNLAKLRSVQEYCTMRLNSRGHVFLNEVLDELGLSRTTAGAVVGWKSKKYGGRDGFVDFGGGEIEAGQILVRWQLCGLDLVGDGSDFALCHLGLEQLGQDGNGRIEGRRALFDEVADGLGHAVHA